MLFRSLATAGTLRADKYIHTREKFAEGIRIEEHVGQGFVELVESGNIYGEEAEATVRKSLEPLLSCGADTIVLGCTHYPFHAGTIGKVAAELVPDRQITIIDPAPAVASHLADVMEEEGLSKSHPEGYGISLYSSGDPTALERTFGTLL